MIVTMKKIGVWLCMAVILLAASCSENSKMRNVLEGVPADADVVAVVNLREVLESAGGSVDGNSVKFPSFIMDELSERDAEDIDEIKDFLLKSGLDPEVCAFVADYEKQYPVTVFSLKDKKQFVKKIEDMGYREKSSNGSGVIYSKKVYEGHSSDYDDYGYIAVADDYVYRIDRVWVGSSFKPVQYLRRIMGNASEDNFASTIYCDYLMDGNVGGLYAKFPKDVKRELRKSGAPSDLLAFCDGAVCLRGSLDVNKLVMDAMCFDADGKELDMSKLNEYINTSATISEDALSYLGRNDCVVYAVSLKDFAWDKYADMLAEIGNFSRTDRAELSVVVDYLRKIDGTIAMGFGLTNGLESIGKISSSNGNDILDQVSVTLVVETKDGKAKQVTDDLKALLDEVNIPTDKYEDGFTVNLGRIGFNGTIELRHKGNFVVIANHQVKQGSCNAVVKNAGLEKNIGALFLGLDRDNKLMCDLNVKYDTKLKMSCEPEKLHLKVEFVLDGDDSIGLIAKIAKAVIGVKNNAAEIKEIMGVTRTSYNYDIEDNAEEIVEVEIDEYE